MSDVSFTETFEMKIVSPFASKRVRSKCFLHSENNVFESSTNVERNSVLSFVTQSREKIELNNSGSLTKM